MITGQIATDIYVKYMEIRTNSMDEKPNIELGPALRLNKQREMRSSLKGGEQREYEKCWELNQKVNPGSAAQRARAHHPACGETTPGHSAEDIPDAPFSSFRCLLPQLCTAPVLQRLKHLLNAMNNPV